MPGFSSVDDFVNEITTNGKIVRLPFTRTVVTGATASAGQIKECLTGTGTGGSLVITGSAGASFSMNRTSAGALPLNGDVSTDLRYLIGMNLFSPAPTLSPAVFVLCDILLCYPSCVVTGAATTITNPVSIPRYTTGEGVQILCLVASALGAATPTLTITYTDSDGNTGNTATVAAAAVSLPIGSALGAGTAGTLTGMFATLAAGDRGVRSIQSYSIASGTTGTVSFLLVKPLATMPITTQNVASERDFLFQVPSMPQIIDGACLGLVCQIGGALTTGNVIAGELVYAWG